MFLKELNQFGTIVTTESTTIKKIISVYPDRLSVYHSIFSYMLSLNQYKTVLITVNRLKKKSFSTKTKMAVFSEYFPSISISNSFVEHISTYEDGYPFGKKIFKSAVKPIIYCNSDDVAVGFYQAAFDLYLKNKIYFYLIGENNQLFSNLLSIDTVDFKLGEVGKQAVISLLNKTKTSIAIDAELKKRGVNE